jgi:hypothetical protein
MEQYREMDFDRFLVLLHTTRFCYGCITNQCLHKPRNVSYNDIFSQLLYDKKKTVVENVMFLSFLDNIGFLVTVKLVRAIFILWCSLYVGARVRPHFRFGSEI